MQELDFRKKELTSVGMNFVERVFGHVQHLHVRTELLDERLDDGLSGSRGRNPDAFGGNLLTGILEVVSHHSVEFILLQK